MTASNPGRARQAGAELIEAERTERTLQTVRFPHVHLTNYASGAFR